MTSASPSSSKDASDARMAQILFSECARAILDGKNELFKSKIESYLSTMKEVHINDVFRFHSQGKTLLHIASSKGNHEIVGYILDKASDAAREIINEGDEEGFTPLINATISESIDCMTLLLERGADVNASNKSKASALCYAADDNSIDRMKLLLRYGANIDHISNVGSVLHWAAGHGCSQAAGFLISQGADVNVCHASSPPIFLAAVSSSEETVRVFLTTPSIDLSLAKAGSLTLLHVCAEHGLAESVRLLLATEIGRGFALMRTDEGNLPIHLACMSQHRNIVDMLQPYSGPEFENMNMDAFFATGEALLAAWHETHNSGKREVQSSSSEADSPASSHNDDAEKEAKSINCVPAENEAALERSEELKVKGNALFAAKKYEEAIEAYSASLALNSTNHTVWSNRSASLMMLKRFEDALRDAEVCRRLRPDWPKVDVVTAGMFTIPFAVYDIPL